jgi:DNA-binding transcriptional regulator YhcF (GntR family)
MATEVDTTLKFSLDLKSGVPFYKQVILQVEMAIVDGRLNNGDQLPTVRKLAVELKINPNTVGRAYNELEIRGIVNTQQGTGTFISDKKIELSDVEKEKILSELTRPYLSNARAYGFTLEELINHLKSMAV